MVQSEGKLPADDRSAKKQIPRRPPGETPHTFADGHFTFHLLPGTIAKMKTRGGEVRRIRN